MPLLARASSTRGQKRARGNGREDGAIVSIMANSFAKADLQRSRHDLAYVTAEFEKEENTQILSAVANMMRMGTLQKAIEAHLRASDPAYLSLGKELAAGTKKFKMLRDDFVKKALVRFEPTVFGTKTFKDNEDTLSRATLLSLLSFALNVSEDGQLPSDYAALRFENGLLAFLEKRYKMMGARLHSYRVGEAYGYFKMDEAKKQVLTMIPHTGGGKNRLMMPIPQLGEDGDWVINHLASQAAVLKSEEHVVEIGLLARFEKIVGSPLWPREDEEWKIPEGEVPALAKLEVSTLADAAAGSSAESAQAPTAKNAGAIAPRRCAARRPPAGSGKVVAKAP